MRPKTLWIKHVYAQRASNQITMCTYTYIVWSIQSYSEQQKQCGCLCMDVCVFTKYSAVYIISISSHLSGLYVFDLGRQSRSRRLLRATVLPFLAVALPQRSKVDAVNRIWWHIRRAPNQPDIHIYIYKRIFYWWHCKSQCRVVILVKCIWISKRIYIFVCVVFAYCTCIYHIEPLGMCCISYSGLILLLLLLLFHVHNGRSMRYELCEACASLMCFAISCKEQHKRKCRQRYVLHELRENHVYSFSSASM